MPTSQARNDGTNREFVVAPLAKKRRGVEKATQSLRPNAVNQSVAEPHGQKATCNAADSRKITLCQSAKSDKVLLDPSLTQPLGLHELHEIDSLQESSFLLNSIVAHENHDDVIAGFSFAALRSFDM